MNVWLISFIGLVYLWVAVNYFKDGQIGLGISFIGYAIGNAGLVILTLKLFERSS